MCTLDPERATFRERDARRRRTDRHFSYDKSNPRRSEIVRGTEASPSPRTPARPLRLIPSRARPHALHVPDHPRPRPPRRVRRRRRQERRLIRLRSRVRGVGARARVCPLAVARGPDDVPDSLGALVPLPPRSSPPTLEDELFACRATCHDEAWDPVCVRGRTYANACWSECSSALGGSPADASSSPSRAGACDAKPSDECVRACVSRWGKGEEGNFGWRPACGEDGVTYTTACFASCSGVRFARGECHDLSRA